jgi:hypothetical protein
LGAVSGYQSFSAVGNANTTYYVIANQSASEWEVGIGTYTSSGTTLSRTTVLSSSNSGSLVDFTAGTKDVFVDYPASKAVYEDASGNVDGYPITGGTINGTTIGATTPAAGTFTTLTAQTEVLKGTGQNLLLQSQTFSNAIWSKQSSVTVTSNTTVAPDSTTTASTITADVDLGIYQSIASTIGLPYTQSIYVKAGTATAIMFRDDSGAGRHIVFNPSTGVITSTAGTLISSGSQSFGNGWYRYYFSYLADTTQVRGIVRPNSSGTAQTFIVWGAQTELASPAGTYTVTTTTAVYGTPTLSFSGVSEIGLLSNGALYLQPAGTGALQAQATTSSATGGNARGANAVDWQTLRSAATQVASGAAAVISGGQNNVASVLNATVGGGLENRVSGGYGAISGGYNNSVSNGGFNFIGGGNSNTNNGNTAVLVGGSSNTSSGLYNFIGGGFTNSATASAAVTTQSATMNATTAVTLSGSNASIKVGQYISGTSIAGDTYVAAISGTSLTLSKVASGSSTSTLSFFTPHGVVVGGGNNQATGSYSFIGGGGDAGNTTNRNRASGDWSFVGGGIRNTASGNGSIVVGGGYISGVIYPNTASGNGSIVVGGFENNSTGQVSFIGAGYFNVASGTNSFIGAGQNNNANADGVFIGGGYNGTTRSIQGIQVSPACSSPINGSQGTSQGALLVLGRQTTDATATVLTSNTGAASTTNQIILPNNSAYAFRGTVIANVTGGGNTKAWAIEGAIKRGANAASTALVGTPTVTSAYADAGASTWAITATADTTNGGLKITFTGQAATTIRCVAKLETTEVTF